MEKMQRDLSILNPEIPAGDLSGPETQDNVSMHNFKNTLTAFVRQAEGGEMHNGKEGC